MLQLRQITKDYIVGEQKVHALKGITVDFRKNEFVSVLGPSGCGKTTLMNIIGGLDQYTQGDLLINGKTTKKFKDGDWDNYRNKKIGFVFQSYNLIPHLNVYGNVEMALTISGISKEERNKRTMEALGQVGLVDQKNQRPNQLSGGQMQRVAIARALVNSPEILLADEPTGALDTVTSEQIMALIKEIAKDRLVIMVTHNPDLALNYSTRIIKMLDGKVTDDSNPYDASSDLAFTQKVEQDKAIDNIQIQKDKKKKKDRSAMSYKTALSLSGKNLIKKKGRTLLTAIAGSIGIIGICLILALSGGMNNYIDNMQKDTLASNPITITTQTININQAMSAMGNSQVFEKFPSAKEIYVQKAISLNDIMVRNNLSSAYVSYLEENLDLAWYNDITYKTGQALNVYGKKQGQTNYSKLSNDSSSGGSINIMQGETSVWQMLLKDDFIKSQYDILDGRYPANKNEIVIIVNSENVISESTLIALGLKNVGDEITKYNFADVLGTTYKIPTNDLIYQKIGSSFSLKAANDIDFSHSEGIEVVGILRVKETTSGGVLSEGIGYLKELYSWLQTENKQSEIIQYMNENPTTDPFTGEVYANTITTTAVQLRENDYRMLGGELTPNEINIYPKTFEAKEEIKKILSDYNIGKAKDDMVTYLDMSELMGEALSSMVNIISTVLIGFTAISLIVSSIMIAIITYVSVLERTKEIGILRSIGARKKDVTRVFNAETIIIGFVAGCIGVIFTYLLSLPINLIIKALVGVENIASLSLFYALLMIVISVVITLISGLIPAGKAAKLDPVTALRTE